MTFCEQIIATLIGTIIGFIFALVLFYLTDIIKRNKQKKEIIQLLKREVEFNTKLLLKYLKDINKIIENITANDNRINTYLKYSDFQVIFFGKSIQSGYIYEIFTDDEITKIIDCINHFTLFSENYINNFVGQFKNNEIDQQEMLGLFQFERSEIDKHLNFLRNINFN